MTVVSDASGAVEGIVPPRLAAGEGTQAPAPNPGTHRPRGPRNEGAPPVGSEPAANGSSTRRGSSEPADDGRSDARERARAESQELLQHLSELGPDDRERERVRERLVEMHRPLAEHLARRFANRGEPLDDLLQVASIGLLKAIDRYDPTREVQFSTFATPTILGEIKRYFRDSTWTVHVPRRVQEVRISLTRASETLTHELGRSPSVSELAERLQASVEEVIEAIESTSAYAPASLDAPESASEEGSLSIADTLGAWDEALDNVEYRESLRPLLEELPERERTILLLRFFHNQTQSQIAEQIGVSQMHVSRLLTRTLAQLREGLLGR